METCVITTGLCKRYGSETCVDHLSLQVPEGAVYGFLGPNGAGKTTTLKMLLGLVHPSAGSVHLLGRELTPRTRLDILRDVGSLIESPSYYGHLTARENLEIVRRLRGLPGEEIDEALRAVRLDGQTYYIDCTFDDPVPDRGEYVSDQYFMLTAEELSETHVWDEAFYEQLLDSMEKENS